MYSITTKWYAAFHGHNAQYIYVKIPEQFRADSDNRIRASISDNDSFVENLSLDSDTLTLIGKAGYNDLQPEETMLFRNADLASGDYTLSVEILNPADTVLAGINERFSKPYDGIPASGIDENNAICVKNGDTAELFFPVTPFGLNNLDIDDWVTE